MPRANHLLFHTEAYEADTLQVASFSGSEWISQPYRFEIELASRRSDLDPTQILNRPAHLGLKQPFATTSGRFQSVHKIHGVIASFDEHGRNGPWTLYRAVLVPRLAGLSLSRRSRVFLEKNVLDIVREVITRHESGIQEIQYELEPEAMSRSFPPREYVVQYQETDLDFFQRQCEHEGIFYYFYQDDAEEWLEIADVNDVFTEIPRHVKIPYRPGEPGKRTHEGRASFEEVVDFWRVCQEPVPALLVLKDYNWRTPEVDLAIVKEVDPEGRGVQYLFGEHYKDPPEGRAYAQIRAEEFLCRKRQFVGRGDVRTFRAGYTFQLDEHYRAEFNDRRYLLTEVHHEGRQEIESLEAGAEDGWGYRNRFTAIPAETRYRPARRTRRPRIPGSLNAHVDAAGDGHYAELDELGRYKVKFPLDLARTEGGQATRWIRMVQPYAGPGYGHHFPLHKGTEVAISHINGDPDRPILDGALYRKDHENVVTNRNYTECVMKAFSDNKIIYQNQDDAQWIRIFSPSKTSHIVLGWKNGESPEGIRINTQGGIDCHAGGAVSLAAGASTFNEGAAQQRNMALALGAASMASVAVLAPASGQSIVYTTAGTGTTTGAVMSAGTGLAGGLDGEFPTHTNFFLSGNMHGSIMAGRNLFVGCTIGMDLFAGGVANLVGGLGTFVGSPLGVTIVANVMKAEMISLLNDVRLHAKWRGNVEVTAKKNVRLVAETQNIVLRAGLPAAGSYTGDGSVTVDAKRDFLLETILGRGQIRIEKDLYIQSKKDKRIEMRAGKSSILMENDRIILSADNIILTSNDAKSSVQIHNSGKENFDIEVSTKGKQGYLAKDNIESKSSKMWIQIGKNEIKQVTAKLDATAVKKEFHTDHEDL